MPEFSASDLSCAVKNALAVNKSCLSEYTDNENPYDAYPSTDSDLLRDDSVVPGLDIPDVKKVSEEFLDGYFRVPKVLGEGA